MLSLEHSQVLWHRLILVSPDRGECGSVGASLVGALVGTDLRVDRFRKGRHPASRGTPTGALMAMLRSNIDRNRGHLGLVVGLINLGERIQEPAAKKHLDEWFRCRAKKS